MTEIDLGDLWARCGSGDRAARADLINNYWPLVRRMARILGAGVPSSMRDDLTGFGAIGLIDAIDKFRPELGCAFETYGRFRIRGAIRDGIRDSSWFPRGANMRSSRRISSIELVDFQTRTTRSGLPLSDTVADPQPSPLDTIVLDEDRAEVAEIVDALPERERTVVLDRYYRNRLLSHTADGWNLSESRICQLHRRALEMIKERLATA
jgi:RNA polymerase sigma factor for flagellar operon FliA